MAKNDRYLKENIFLYIMTFLIIIGISWLLIGCTAKKETIKCIGGNLYNVIPNTSYILIRKGCKSE